MCVLSCVLHSASCASNPMMTTDRSASVGTGPQFNFHFTASAYRVDGGRRKIMLHLRPNHLFLCRSEACSTSSWSMRWKPELLNSWLRMAGSCGSLADVAWGASGLCRGSCQLPVFICSPRAVAVGLSLRAAASTRREAGDGGRIQTSTNEAAARFIWCCCSLNPWSLGGRGRRKDCI